MYIEFRLPTGSSGQAAAYVNQIIKRELDHWSKRYGIDYVSKNVKYTKRVTFEDETNYSFFALTWNPAPGNFRNYLLNYRLVEPMNRV